MTSFKRTAICSEANSKTFPEDITATSSTKLFESSEEDDQYNAACDAAVSWYEEIKAEREKVVAGIRRRGIRRREFDDAPWGSLVDCVPVGKDKTMVFTLIGGTERIA